MTFFILFNLVLTKLQDNIYRFLKFKMFLRYSWLKSKATTCSIWDTQTKTAKIYYFTKNLFPFRFSEINTSNYQEMFHDIFRNTVGRSFR